MYDDGLRISKKKIFNIVIVLANGNRDNIRRRKINGFLIFLTASSAVSGVASYGALGHVPPLKLQKAIKIV
jgi:hypothetical protein